MRAVDALWGGGVLAQSRYPRNAENLRGISAYDGGPMQQQLGDGLVAKLCRAGAHGVDDQAVQVNSLRWPQRSCSQRRTLIASRY